jgi:hypothetical protein
MYCNQDSAFNSAFVYKDVFKASFKKCKTRTTKHFEELCVFLGFFK